MKKKATIIIGILAVVLVSLICVILFGPKENNTNNNDILTLSTKSDVQEYVTEQKIDTYSFDSNAAFLRNINVFGENAEIEFYMTEDAVDEIDVCFVLFQSGIDEEYKNDTDVSDEVPVYNFADKDRESINKSFENIKAKFEEYIGCKFDGYDVVPVENNENLENNEDNFYNGKFIKEFSVRDSSGTLWIMRFEAAYGSATTVIQKLVNESGFDGFVPRIDMTNK